MGPIRATVSVENPNRPDLAPLVVPALADSGARHLCIPEHVALQLQLNALEKREVILADGSKRAVSYVGPVQLRVANRSGFTGAMVLGDEVVLGSIPMDDMDLVVIPTRRQVAPNPQNPNMPGSIARGVRSHRPKH